MQQDHVQNLKLLLLQISSGDEDAFEALFKLYGSQLNAYIMTISRSEPLTEEMVQDVFLKIWLNRKSLTEIDSFKSYLFVIAKNYTFDCLKKIKRKQKREKEWIDMVINDSLVAPAECLDEVSYQKIDQAVKLLPTKQKKIYLLRRDGTKQAEIAKELNISTETVKKHLFLAKRFLKDQIKLSRNLAK